MPNVRLYKKKAGVQITKNFNSNEFDCKCEKCTETLIDLDFVNILQLLRDRIGKTATMTCGYRCPAHNKAEGGVSNSQHILGIAGDIVFEGISPNQVADLADPLFNGMGRYDTFTHVDNRLLGQKGTKARWDFRSKK